MQKERAARALESGLPVQTPLPHLLSSRVSSSRPPSAATRRARLLLVALAVGFTALLFLYGALSLTEQAPALAAGAASASGGANLGAVLRAPTVTPKSSSK